MHLINTIIKFLLVWVNSGSYTTAKVLHRCKGASNRHLISKIKVAGGRIELYNGISFPISRLSIFGNDLSLLVESIEKYKVTVTDKGFVFQVDCFGQPVRMNVVINDNLTLLQEVFMDLSYNFVANGRWDVIDVGMNVGSVSLFFAALPYVDRVYSYELVPNTCLIAEQNIALNPEIASKIKTFPYGLAKEPMKFEIPEAYDGAVGASASDFVIEYQKERYAWNTGRTLVEVRKASDELRDFICASANSIALKLDCEGAEYEILEQLEEEELLGKIKILMMEWHFKDPKGLIDRLKANSFSVFCFDRSTDFPFGFIYAVKDSSSNKSNQIQ